MCVVLISVILWVSSYFSFTIGIGIVFIPVWFLFIFFFKQKTAYEMRISDWSSDVCSSDLIAALTGDVTLDGQRGDVGKLMTYKGTLIQDVPNLGIIVGYTNAPWTLKADLSARYLCRLFNYMDEKQLREIGRAHV